MDQEYFAYTRKEILPLLPQKISTVLEVGCGFGNTLAWIKSIRNCTWAGGVELSPHIAEQARKNVDDVYVGNIEHMVLPLANESIDLLLCLDVLEHLVDPWTVIRNLKALLKPGGALIVSIPNIRNINVLFPLLFRQKWEYTEAGILDRTHLRFFVKESAVHLVSSSGFIVDMVTATGLGKSRKSRIINSAIPSLIRSLFEKQYVIRGIKPPSQTCEDK